MTNLQLEIRVVGVVPAELLEELDGVQVVTESVETVLRGSLADQAALIGMINRLQSLGVELREVRQLGIRRRRSGRCPTTRSPLPAGWARSSHRACPAFVPWRPPARSCTRWSRTKKPRSSYPDSRRSPCHGLGCTD